MGITTVFDPNFQLNHTMKIIAMEISINVHRVRTTAQTRSLQTERETSRPPTHPNHKNCAIKGVGAGTINTFGIVNANVVLGPNLLNHDFQIVPPEFPVPGDGILGLDFLKKFNCLIDYADTQNYLYIRPTNITHTLAVEIIDSPTINLITIPARSEVIRKIQISSSENEAFIPNQELAQGVYVAGTIISKSSPYVRILNTSFDNKTVAGKVNTEPLSNYNIFNLNSHKPTRREVVLQKLRKNFPSFAKEKLDELCKEYEDIFALESDGISKNNFYSQTLKMTDNSPVYIKNYRIPHVHKQEIQNQVSKLLKDNI